MMTGASTRNIGKLFFELKLVTDNLLFITLLVSRLLVILYGTWPGRSLGTRLPNISDITQVVGLYLNPT